MTIDNTSALTTDALTATTPKVLPDRLLDHLASLPLKLSEILRPNQRWYMKFFNQNIPATPKLSMANFAYVDCRLLIILSIEIKADKYNNKLNWAYGRFKNLHVTERPLTVDDNGIPNIIFADRSTLVGSKVSHPRRIKTSTSSFEDKNYLKTTKPIPSPLQESGPRPLQTLIAQLFSAENTSFKTKTTNKRQDIYSGRQIKPSVLMRTS